MKLRDAMRLAASGLRGSPIRTLLTILGLAVGVGAVLTVMTLGTAGEIRVEAEIARLGVDKVWIRAGDQEHILTAEDAALIADATGVPACAGMYCADAVMLGDILAAAQIAGYDPGMLTVYGSIKTEEGRLFCSLDYEGGAVCLTDEALAESLGGDVLGRYVSVAGRHLRVVGVISGMPMQGMMAGSGLLVLPLATYQDTFGDPIGEITLAVPAGQSAEKIADAALAALAQESFRADTLEEEIDAAREVVRIFVMVLACVAVVCMLTGAIGVMNVLLVSVRERRREIGLIKALGGTSGQVALLFLLEAAAYALLGGVLGTGVGAAMIRLCGAWIGLAAALKLRTAVPVIAAAGILGVCFGVVPAIRAASLEPVESLRSE